MKYISSGESRKGTDYKRNEDHYLIKEDIGLHMVCDGIGEGGQGGVASQMTIDFVAQVILANKKILLDYKNSPSDVLKKNIHDLVDKAIKKISHQISTNIHGDPGRRLMGSTLSMVLVINNSVFLAHVGNSRIYLVREESVHLLTDDHVLKKYKQNKNHLGEGLNVQGQALSNLTRMIGSPQEVIVDVLHFEVMPGDTILLLTDGVTNSIDNAKMFDIISHSREENLSKDIISYVNQANEKDNATAVTISFERAPEAKKAELTNTPQVKFSTLQQIPLFSQLDYKEISKLLDLMSNKKFLKDECVVTEGETGEELYVIISGTADVVINKQIIANLKSGDYFGELSLIDQEPRSATIKATSNLDTLVLTKKEFYHVLTHEPQISVKVLWRFVQTLSARMRHFDHGLVESHKTNSKIDIAKCQKIVLNFD